MAASNKIVSVSTQSRAVVRQFPGTSTGSVMDPSGLLQPVQRDVQDQRRYCATLGTPSAVGENPTLASTQWRFFK